MVMHNFDFDDEFFNGFNDEMKRLVKPRKIARIGFGLWLTAATVGIGFWVAVIYVLLHFVGKFW
jgi:hypothetical protein